MRLITISIYKLFYPYPLRQKEMYTLWGVFSFFILSYFYLRLLIFAFFAVSSALEIQQSFDFKLMNHMIVSAAQSLWMFFIITCTHALFYFKKYLERRGKFIDYIGLLFCLVLLGASGQSSYFAENMIEEEVRSFYQVYFPGQKNKSNKSQFIDNEKIYLPRIASLSLPKSIKQIFGEDSTRTQKPSKKLQGKKNVPSKMHAKVVVKPIKKQKTIEKEQGQNPFARIGFDFEDKEVVRPVVVKKIEKKAKKKVTTLPQVQLPSLAELNQLEPEEIKRIDKFIARQIKEKAKQAKLEREKARKKKQQAMEIARKVREEMAKKEREEKKRALAQAQKEKEQRERARKAALEAEKLRAEKLKLAYELKQKKEKERQAKEKERIERLAQEAKERKMAEKRLEQERKRAEQKRLAEEKKRAEENVQVAAQRKVAEVKVAKKKTVDKAKLKKANTWKNLASVYFLNGDCAKASKYLEKAIKSFEASGAYDSQKKKEDDALLIQYKCR